jgi:hypothetical protein
MSLPNVPIEFFTTFNEVTYYDEPHKYFVGNKELISMTTLIKKYKPAFDIDFWSLKKAQDFNLDQETIKYLWNFNNDRAGIMGSILHDYAENMFLNKVFPYPMNTVLDRFGHDATRELFEFKKERFNRFYELTKNRLYTIRTEYVVWDKEFDLGGMVDLLMYNVKTGDFEIWDHKTNKEFTYKSKHGNFYNPPFDYLEDCKFTEYSLQLSGYKYIIEKYTGLKLGSSKVIWYGNEEEDWKVIEMRDMTPQIKQMLELHKEEIAA